MKQRFKEGEMKLCPNCKDCMYWVELGEPEGALFSCEHCASEFDGDLQELT